MSTTQQPICLPGLIWEWVKANKDFVENCRLTYDNRLTILYI